MEMISTLDMSHAEWLEDRRKGLGGSDIATVLGLNKWKSPYQLWLDKTGQIELEFSESEPAYWGNVLEEVVASEFQERTGKKVRRRNQVFVHDDYPFLRANIDRDVVGENAILECKTANAYLAKDWEGEEIPLAYICQVQHYMKFILLETESVGPESDAFQVDDKDKPAIKLEKLADILQQDALFLEYSEKVVNDVLSAFRLPPVYVGRSQDYNRSTVETAKELTEEQVFQPRREGYEWRLNNMFNDYGFQYVEIYLKSPDFSNTEDIKNILDPAIRANAVAPNDLRPFLSKVLNLPLEPFEDETFNTPFLQAKGGGIIDIDGLGTFNTDVSKAYGDSSEQELAGLLRRAMRRSESG